MLFQICFKIFLLVVFPERNTLAYNSQSLNKNSKSSILLDLLQCTFLDNHFDDGNAILQSSPIILS
jgi:hypothetical protein